MALSLWLVLSFVNIASAQELLPGNPKPPVSNVRPYTILNLNILYCDPQNGEGYSGYIKRLTALIERLRLLNPDLMVFQEVANCKFIENFKYLNVAKIVASNTGTQHHFWKSEGVADIWDEGLGFFWNPQRVQFDSIRCGHFKTSKRIGLFEIKKSLCRGDLHLPSGETIRVYNTHLDVEERYSFAQTQEILGIAAKELPPEAPLALMGDFNNPALSPAIQKIEDFGLSRLAYDDVDFVFTRGLEGRSRGGVVDFKSAGISDHNGLWLEIFPGN